MILVDDMYRYSLGQLRSRRGRIMKMSHMISDTSHHELHQFARELGVKREWFQEDHYDISLEVRELAVKAGACEVSMRDMACIRALIKWGSWVAGTPITSAKEEWRIHRENFLRQYQETEPSSDDSLEMREARGVRLRGRAS